MANIIGIKFRTSGKVYYFAPPEEPIKKGDGAIVETARGIEYGEVVMGVTDVSEDKIVHPLKPIIRKATDADKQKLADNRKRECAAFPTAKKKIEQSGLEMKLVDVEYSFDDTKIIFYFTADGRIDFRELVKDLASQFKTRIELRQIGVRDESKMLGGLGICGNCFCCQKYLSDFQPVSIKMAKEQGLSLNPAKISGACGRLMCCLKYEQDVYDELIAATPPNGSIVDTPDGRGRVIDSNLLGGTVKVLLLGNTDSPPKSFKREDIVFIGAKPVHNKPSGSPEGK